MNPVPDPAHRGRLRLERLEGIHDADGALRVEVGLEWGGRVHRATAAGLGTRQGALRAGGTAAVEAASSATDGRVKLHLAGIKAIRAFDRWLVISSVTVHDGGRLHRLLGAREAPEDNLAAGAVFSVLDAMNRFLTPYLADPDE
jgi:hypothetical protein